jgi:hypothetical protein
MQTKIATSEVPRIASLYAQCRQLPVLTAIDSSRDEEEVLEDYKENKERLREVLMDHNINKGLINRLEKRFRKEMIRTLQQLGSDDYEEVISYIQGDF